jgi:hypothetical protein
MSNCADRDWLFAADEVLATVEPSVLKAICMQEGNLPQLYDSNKTVRDVLDRYYKRGDEQATINIRALTLGNGHMPMTLDCASLSADRFTWTFLTFCTCLRAESNIANGVEEVRWNAIRLLEREKLFVPLAKVGKAGPC